jgi:hypothetical protein
MAYAGTYTLENDLCRAPLGTIVAPSRPGVTPTETLPVWH